MFSLAAIAAHGTTLERFLMHAPFQRAIALLLRSKLGWFTARGGEKQRNRQAVRDDVVTLKTSAVIMPQARDSPKK